MYSGKTKLIAQLVSAAFISAWGTGQAFAAPGCSVQLTNNQSFTANTCSDSAAVQVQPGVAATSLTVNAGVTLAGDSGLYNRDYGGVVMGSAFGAGDASLVSLVNSGSILGGAGGIGINMWSDAGATHISTLTNNGLISGNIGLLLVNNATIDYLINNAGATISGTNGDDAIRIQTGGINTIINAGTISGANSGLAIGGVSIAEINNSGIITGTNFGINTGATITTFTNTGSIGGPIGIKNTGTITTLNNAQSNLTYQGVLPANYNIIINSASSYGKMAVTSPTGTTRFGIHTSSNAGPGTYASVMSGVTSANFNALTGGFGAWRWTLSDANLDNAWDLVLQGTVLASAQLQGNNPGLNAAAVIDQNAELLNLFNGLTTAEQQSNGVSQTLPLLTGSATAAMTSALHGTNRVIQARQEGQHGRSTGDEFFGDQHFWMKPFGSWANQDNRKGVSGYDADTYGLVFGADGEFNEANRIGLGFSYARSDVDSNSSVAPNSADVDSYQLVVYGSRSITDKTELSYQADVGYHKTDGERDVSLLLPGQTAKSDYDSWSGHLGLALARTYDFTQKTSLTPSVRIDYTRVDSESYQEKGADALNLDVDDNTAEELILSVDAKLAHQMTDRATLTANLGIGYDLINEGSAITSAFAGTPGTAFVTRGLDPDAWSYRGGLGVVGNVTEALEVTARYDFELKEDFDNQTASLKMRWAF